MDCRPVLVIENWVVAEILQMASSDTTYIQASFEHMPCIAHNLEQPQQLTGRYKVRQMSPLVLNDTIS